MLKKIIFLLVILAIGVGILFSMGLLDNFLGSFNEIRISVDEESVLQRDSQKGDTKLGVKGYLMFYDNFLETYDNNGQMISIHEFDEFIEKVFWGREKFVVTVDSIYIEMDGGFQKIEFDKESSKLLNINQDDRIFFTRTDTDETTNIVDIYDGSMKYLASLDSDRMRVIKTMDSDNSDGVIITTFSYEGTYITSKVGEYLVEGMYKLWELDLGNEIVIFQYTAKDGNYIVTDKNLYKINNTGSILWTYSGYEYIKDCEFTSENIILLTGKENSEITTINNDGNVEGILRTEDSFTRLDVYKDNVFLSNSSLISYVAGEKVLKLYNPDKVMKALKFSDNKLRILFDSSIVELNIKID